MSKNMDFPDVEHIFRERVRHAYRW